jgi:protein-tyrosine phosphatase
MAELVLRHKAKTAGVSIHAESAGLSVERLGQPAAAHAVTAELARGYEPRAHVSRSVEALDLVSFEFIVGMTSDHVSQLKQLMLPSNVDKVRHFMSFVPGRENEDLQDPYGGTVEDYDKTLDVIEVGATTLLSELTL